MAKKYRTNVLAAGLTGIGGMLLLSGCSAGPFGMFHQIPQRAFGIDVSVYQHTINWNAVAADRVQFAWAKATEGSAKCINYGDEYLAANMAGASRAGVLIGAYHFAHPRMDSAPGGAEEEAQPTVTRHLEPLPLRHGCRNPDVRKSGQSAPPPVTRHL
jgi:hypothetical protein